MTPERRKEVQLSAHKWQLQRCDELLTAAGVPKWVNLPDGTPANSVSCRLNWFLLRRKDVSETEKRQGVDREMALSMQHAKDFQADNSPVPK